ncbi:MAG: hypothetical protein AAFP19_21930 [Bacteroidota bacterium]
MKSLNKPWNSLWVIGFFAVFMLLFTACETEAPTTTTETVDTTETSAEKLSPVTRVERQYFHAWLSYVTSGELVTASSSEEARDKLIKLGKGRIEKALGDNIILDRYYPKSDYPDGVKLAWGPVVTPQFIDSISTGLTENLLYVIETKKTDTTMLYIGTSGTNMISGYDWFVEDFDVTVKDQKDWKARGGQTKGKISGGTHIGLEALLNMVDTSMTDNPSLITYLNQVFSRNETTNYKITVAGHSLGGALAPVLALKLRENFTVETLTVEAWPFAGPTPGNSDFASYLTTTLDQYHAYNNSLDVVPHAWELDSLNRLCDIYDHLYACDDVIPITTEESTILGVLSYFRTVSSGGDYKIPGKPITFTADYSAFKGLEGCGEFIGAIGVIVASQEPSDLLKGLIDLNNTCKLLPEPNLNNKTERDIFETLVLTTFLNYMVELGGQHTTAYFNHFVTDANVQKQLDKYVTNAKTDLDSFVDDFLKGALGLPILENVISKANSELVKKGISDCDCPSEDS